MIHKSSYIIIIGTLVHFIYVLSIFDIYFKSPIDQGINPVEFPTNVTPPAKRLVLIVGDGLRADTCFNFLGRDDRYHKSMRGPTGIYEASYQADKVRWPTENTSFLRDIVELKGSFGVSHTQVPTESRPGHVAMIAGFNEDVSAVAKGWQDNPVEFDHVFNQSTRTWAWGSPDITRMFSKHHAHVQDEYYSAEEEDFASKDLSWLDTWVFNKVAALFNESKTNETLNEQLHGEQNVFFLHLLGLDSNGHAHRPASHEYAANMALVDRGISGIYHLFEDFFNDNQTAYIFTADHGMASIGSHGDGDPANTRTPVIAWGAGVTKPQPAKEKEWINKLYQTSFTEEEERSQTISWGLGHLFRKDMKQADIAPLMSTLIGVPVPVNSVGMLPHSMIAQGEYRATASLVNAKQLVKQVLRKQELKSQQLLYFRPYPGLKDGLERIAEIEKTIENKEFARAEKLSLDLFDRCTLALDYYLTYDSIFLISTVVAGYLGWVIFLLYFITSSDEKNDKPRSLKSRLLTMSVIMFSTLVFVKLLLEKALPQYYIYVLLPSYFWISLLWNNDISAVSIANGTQDILRLVFYFIILQSIGLGYTYRFVFAGIMTLLGFWPLEMKEISSTKTIEMPVHEGCTPIRVPSELITGLWMVSCIILGSFTFLPLDMNNDPTLMIVGGLSVFGSCTVLLFGPLKSKTSSTAHSLCQVSLILLALFLALYTDWRLQQKLGLTYGMQLGTRFVFIVSLILPLFSCKSSIGRYISIYTGLAPPFILLSVNFEVLFYTVLGFLVLQWVLIERTIILTRSKVQERKDISPSSIVDDVRVALMFLILTHMAFFGTGNFASMSSFQLSSTYRFITVFSPFLMGGLLIIKLMIPYTLVTSLVSTLAVTRLESGVSVLSPSKLFILVIALCDLIALHLFFWVRNEGSWKQIGNSISQFGFSNAQLVLLPLLFLIASIYQRGVRQESAAKSHTM